MSYLRRCRASMWMNSPLIIVLINVSSNAQVPNENRTTMVTAVAENASALFDCQAALSNFELEWSEDKKVWCCEQQQLGCVRSSSSEAPPGAEFDCQEKLEDAATEWSPAKQAWCCTHRQLGCSDASNGDGQFDCTDKLEDALTEWSEEKKQKCCSSLKLGCPGDAVQPGEAEEELFDCQAALSNFALEWSEDKMAWCCETHHLGCLESNHTTEMTFVAAEPSGGSATESEDLAAKPFDCQDDTINWQRDWSDEKKSWCCDNEQVGCSIMQAGEGTQPINGFDCQSGIYNWEAEWPDAKKTWCCDRQQLGCVTSQNTGTSAFGIITALVLVSGAAAAGWFWYKQRVDSTRYSKIGGSYSHSYRPPAAYAHFDNL